MPIELPKEIEDGIAMMSDEELAFRGWTKEGMRMRYQQRLEDDINSPQVGEQAPDFRLERLSAEGKRIGEYLTLSSLRGKPVGLIFGSYT